MLTPYSLSRQSFVLHPKSQFQHRKGERRRLGKETILVEGRMSKLVSDCNATSNRDTLTTGSCH